MDDIKPFLFQNTISSVAVNAQHKISHDNISGGESSGSKKKVKYYCSFNDQWLKNNTWLSKIDQFTAKCNICHIFFSVKFDGFGAVKNHAASAKHQKFMKTSQNGPPIPCVLPCENNTEEDLIIAAEITSTFHGIKHQHSYNSQDCGHKLNAVMFADSFIAKKISCGRTKASSIVESVLGPASQERIVSNLKASRYFSVASDSSNKGNLKMYPLLIKYFSLDSGIQTGLLDFYEDNEENSEAIKYQIINILTNNGLKASQISAYTVDNGSANYELNVSVYQQLNTINPNIIKANCTCHILHYCVKHSLKALSVDIELIVLKVYSELSAFARNRIDLKITCSEAEIEFREILKHVPTQWLSLHPAINRIITLWPALTNYFLALGEENCSSFIWQTFCAGDCQRNTALCVLYFVQNVMQVFQNAMKLLEADKVTSTEIYDIMVDLRTKLQNRQADQFYGKFAMNLLQHFDDAQKNKVKTEINSFFIRCLNYLQYKYNFEDPEYKAMKVLSLKEPITWEGINNLQELLKLDLNTDQLYDEVGILREMQAHLAEENRVDLRWVDFFAKTDARNPCPELKKLVAFVLSIPVSNASCERVFSLMEQVWSKERNKMNISLVKAELLILQNFEFSCINFHNYVLTNREILDRSKNKHKYKFSK